MSKSPLAPPRRSTTPLLLGVIAAVIALVVVVALVLSGGDDDDASDAGSEATAATLVGAGVRTVVVTHGGDPVQWWSDGESGSVPAKPIVVVDTLGAGDAFHGAYSYFSTRGQGGVAERIERSAHVAALRCSMVGPRAWLSELSSEQIRK